MSRFFINFLGGAAKQFNANVAAQKEQENKLERIDYEYGIRQTLQQQQDEAAMARKRLELGQEAFDKFEERQNKIRVEQEKGRQTRQTEILKSKLSGQGTGLDNYQWRVENPNDPNNPTVKGFTIPKSEGKTEGERYKDRLRWFENNAAKQLAFLQEEGRTEDVQRFQQDLATTLISVMNLPENTVKDDLQNINAYKDITGLYPNVRSIVAQDQNVRTLVESNVPAIVNVLKKGAGFPENADVPVENIGSDAIGVTNPPEYYRNDDGSVNMELFEPVTKINTVGQREIRGFYNFVESAAPQDPRTFVDVFAQVDNLYKPELRSNPFRPSLAPDSIEQVAASLSPLRYELTLDNGQVVGGPKVLAKTFEYIASNDEFATGNLIPATDKVTVSAKKFKDETTRDLAEFQSEAKASNRVVRMTSGVKTAVMQGGLAGLPGNVLLAAAGFATVAREFTAVGDEIISYLQSTNAMTETDANIRRDNISFLTDVNKRIKQGDLSNVSATAMLRYYSTLLAYSMAVAVQGGDAAARTVSDQDVQRVAAGAAPAAPGSGRWFVSTEELMTITQNVEAEFAERAAIADLYLTREPAKMRAGYYYEKTFADRPMDFNSLMKTVVSEQKYNALYADQTSPTGSGDIRVRQQGNTASERFKANLQNPSATVGGGNQPAPRPNVSLEINEPTGQ